MSETSLSNLSIGVATMHGRGVVPRFSTAPYLVFDQGDEPDPAGASIYGYHFMDSRGLSISRNLALQCCDTKYLLFADDDVFHVREGVEQIALEFERTNADILTFMIRTPDGGLFRNYKKERFSHSRRSLFRVSSIEIAIRVDSVRRVGLQFDTRFGLGAENPTGEEVIFLLDAYNAGLDIRFSPIVIVTHPKESSGSNLIGNHRLIRAKGAMFGRIFGYWGLLYCIAFSAKHYRKSGLALNFFLREILLGCIGFVRQKGC